LQLLGQGKHRLSPVVMPFPWGQAMPRRIPAPLWIFIGAQHADTRPQPHRIAQRLCEAALTFRDKALFVLTGSYLLL
jgi:hypothetical protein